MKYFLNKIKFAIQFRTLRSVVVDPENKQNVLFVSKSGLRQCPRRCPHQGAPLDQYGLVRGRELICGWHGCRLSGLRK